MSDELPMLIHIGYHKTATTWMQKHLFMPTHGYQQVMGHQDVFDMIVKPHGLRFDPELARAALKVDTGTKVPVISSEVLSGHPFQGGHESDVYAERLAAIAPNAKILVSIRDQMSIIPSVYMQYLQTMPFDRFYEGTDRPGYFGFTPEHFEYDVLVAHYQNLFGAENVYVMTQESLKTDMEGAASDLALFAGAHEYTDLAVSARKVHAASYPEYAAGALRRTNHVQTSTLNPRPIVSFGQSPDGLFKVAGGIARRWPIKPLLAGRKPISEYVAKRFEGRYVDHNKRLAEIVQNSVDLSKYC